MTRRELLMLLRPLRKSIRAWELFADYPIDDEEYDDSNLYTRSTYPKEDCIEFLNKDARKAKQALSRLEKQIRSLPKEGLP